MSSKMPNLDGQKAVQNFLPFSRANGKIFRISRGSRSELGHIATP